LSGGVASPADRKRVDLEAVGLEDLWLQVTAGAGEGRADVMLLNRTCLVTVERSCRSRSLPPPTVLSIFTLSAAGTLLWLCSKLQTTSALSTMMLRLRGYTTEAPVNPAARHAEMLDAVNVGFQQDQGWGLAVHHSIHLLDFDSFER